MKFKIKLISAFIILNIIVMVGTFIGITAMEAKYLINNFVGNSEYDIRSTYNKSNDCSGITSKHTPYIDGKLNDEYVAELIATYTLLSESWMESDGVSGCYGVAYDEKNNIIGESGNNIIFSYVNDEDNYIEKYRICDMDKFLEEEDIKGIERFIEQNSVNFRDELIYLGKTDGFYVYPKYILTDDAYRENSNVIDHQYRYTVETEYEYYYEDNLQEFSSNMMDSWDGKYMYLELLGCGSLLNSSLYLDVDNNKYYNEAKTNLSKVKDVVSTPTSDPEEPVFEKLSVFDCERIYFRQVSVEGHTISEYISFVSKPFIEAIDYCWFRYLQAFIVIIALNLIALVVVKFYTLKRDEYTYYAKKVFLEITSNLRKPLENIEKMHDSIAAKDVDKEEVTRTRELIDKEISLMNSNVTDILNMSKMEAGILNIEIDEVELGYLVQTIVDKKKASTKSKFECDIDEELVVNGDLMKLARTITVLVESVIKRTDNIETIYVEVKKKGNMAYFGVSNRAKSLGLSFGFNDAVSKDLFSKKNMQRDGYELILAKGYLNLHNADYGWSNDEGNVRYWFKMPVDLKENDTKAQKKNDIKKIYGVVAHEIKTPLNVIRLHNEALKEDILDENETKKYKEIISNQIEIIKTQLEQIINTNKLEDGSLQMINENIDMIKVVKEAMSSYKLLIEDKKLDVELDMLEELIVKADKNGVYNIVSNYIVNAIKYSKVGGSVKITVQENKKYVIFKTINSNAVSMNSSLNDIIDGKDAKAENKKIINRIEKDGLGLLIAKSYIKLHKGSFGNIINDDTVEYWVKLRVR